MTTELTASYRTFESKRNALVKHLKGVIRDADDLLKNVSDSTADEFNDVRTKTERLLFDARSRLEDARAIVTEGARDAADATQEYVRENPWKVVGALGAVAAGLVIGFMLTRR